MMVSHNKCLYYSVPRTGDFNQPFEQAGHDDSSGWLPLQVPSSLSQPHVPQDQRAGEARP